MRNMRLRYFKTEKEFEDSRLEANAWNVLRRPDNDENHWHYQDRDGAVVSIMRTRTTMWIGKDKQCGNGTVGIVLLDPTVRQGQPLDQVICILVRGYCPNDYRIPMVRAERRSRYKRASPCQTNHLHHLRRMAYSV